MRYVIVSLCLTSCGFSDPRTPTLSEDSKLQILFKAQQTANWAPWCETWPSKDFCNDADAMAHGIGYLAAVGFRPSIEAIDQSIDGGQLKRSPAHKPLDNTASRDQFLGFIAGQLSGETRWLDVKRFIKEHGRICKDATDARCESTPQMPSISLTGEGCDVEQVNSNSFVIKVPTPSFDGLSAISDLLPIWDALQDAEANFQKQVEQSKDLRAALAEVKDALALYRFRLSGLEQVAGRLQIDIDGLTANQHAARQKQTYITLAAFIAMALSFIALGLALWT